MTELADYVGSTSGIIRAVAEDEAKTCLIGTELGVLYELKSRIRKGVLSDSRQSSVVMI